MQGASNDWSAEDAAGEEAVGGAWVRATSCEYGDRCLGGTVPACRSSGSVKYADASVGVRANCLVVLAGSALVTTHGSVILGSGHWFWLWALLTVVPPLLAPEATVVQVLEVASALDLSLYGNAWVQRWTLAAVVSNHKASVTS